MIEVILENTKYISPFTWEILKPVLIAVIFVYIAAWKARKEIKNYLLQKTLIKQTEDIEDNNKETNKLATDFLNQTQDALDLSQNQPVASKNDIQSIIKAADALYKASVGASRPITTFSCFLSTSCDAFQNLLSHDDQSQIKTTPVKQDIYGLFMRGASIIEDYSAYTIEVPRKIKFEYKNSIKPRLAKYVKGEGVKAIPGISRGVDLDPLSFHSLEFYDQVLKPFKPERLGGAHRYFFQLIGNNPIMLIYLKERGIYYPTRLEYTDDFLGAQKILLIHIETLNITPGNKKQYNLYYSNINPWFKFMHNFKTKEKFEEIFGDSNFTIPDVDFSSAIKKIQYIGFETIKITVEEGEGKKAYKLARDQIEKLLCANAEMSVMHTCWHMTLTKLNMSIATLKKPDNGND